jgi:hypothetical protein
MLTSGSSSAATSQQRSLRAGNGDPRRSGTTAAYALAASIRLRASAARREHVRGNPVAAGWRSPTRMQSCGRRRRRGPVPRNAMAGSAEVGRSLRGEGSADAVESNSPADGAGLEQLGSCIAGAEAAVRQQRRDNRGRGKGIARLRPAGPLGCRRRSGALRESPRAATRAGSRRIRRPAKSPPGRPQPSFATYASLCPSRNLRVCPRSLRTLPRV